MNNKWWTLAAVCTGVFMLLLDITVVNVALPDIQRSLHSSFSDLQWVVNAYALTIAAFLLTAGVVGDMFGRRRLFAIGLGAFSAASLLCGFSGSSTMLDFARAVQGIGGAIMLATSLALIAAAFSGKERGTAFGIYGAVLGGAVAIGPLVGGALTGGIGWRWIFFVNVPIGLAAIVMTLTRIQESRDPNQRRIDWAGFVSFSLALFLLVFALVRGNDEGWGSTEIVALLIGSGALMAFFLVAEWRQDDPMLDLALFKRPAMVGVSLATFSIAGSMFAMFLYITLYMQDVLGYGPLATGVRFLPLTLIAFAAAPISGNLTTRLPSRFLLSGGLAIVGLALILMSSVDAASSWTVLLPAFIVGGVGIGVANPVIASASVAVVPPQRSGMASGSSNTFRQVGLATGIAGLGAIFQSQVPTKAFAALAKTSAGRQLVVHGVRQLHAAFIDGGVRQVAAMYPRSASRVLLHAYAVGFTASFRDLVTIAGVLAFVGAVAALVLIRQRDFVPSFSAASSQPVDSS
ncbi:MAG TPA: MFS transporter [Solirubrobacteraceae bacterium]|nr:MFS transporter [Solirubrobacteraceae bacterium]